MLLTRKIVVATRGRVRPTALGAIGGGGSGVVPPAGGLGHPSLLQHPSDANIGGESGGGIAARGGHALLPGPWIGGRNRGVAGGDRHRHLNPLANSVREEKKSILFYFLNKKIFFYFGLSKKVKNNKK